MASGNAPRSRDPAAGPSGGFEHCCFVSYRHGPAEEFAEAFAETLDSNLRLLIDAETPVFFDRTGFGPLDLVDGLFLKQCRSVCTVSIYTPVYFSDDHPFCTREWLTMIDAEKKLRPQLKQDQGLIIPVAYRHPVHETVCKGRAEPKDFSSWIPGTRLVKKHNEWFKQLARQIVDLRDDLARKDITSHPASRPTDAEVKAFLDALRRPKPGFPS
jgi:hypothetical protein